MKVLLKEIFGAHPFPSPVIVTHRIDIPRKNQNISPRPLIARIHHYQTKEHILKLGREASHLSFHNSGIHIYPDFSADVARKRAAFLTV